MENIKFSLFAIVVFALSLNSCKEERSLYDSDTDINQYLTENIVLPAGSFRISQDQITQSNDIMITGSGSNITGGPTGFGANVVEGGETANISIDFSASNADVTHAGIQFGDTSDIIIIPIDGAEGETTGTLEFEALFPPELCDNLSNICHDIRCYEYAISGDINGQSYSVSSANINELVGFCGQCDLPSCQTLIGPDCTSTGGGSSNCIVGDWLPVEVCELYNGQLEYCEPVPYCDNTPQNQKIWSLQSNFILENYTIFCNGYTEYDCGVKQEFTWSLSGSTLTLTGSQTPSINCQDGSEFGEPGEQVEIEVTCSGNELTMLIDGYYYIRFDRQ